MSSKIGQLKRSLKMENLNKKHMRKFLVVYEKTKTGYSAYVPDLPGVIATGKARTNVEKNIFSAIQFHLEGLKESKMRIPKTQADSEILVFAV